MMSDRKKIHLLYGEKGSALLLVMIMMTALLGAAGWLGMQTRTETTVVAAVKDYTKSFNAADGSVQISLYYLRNIANPTNDAGVSWNPKKSGGGKITIEPSYQTYINNDQMKIVDNSTDNIETISEIYWLNYSSIPPPGWGLSDKGYGNKFTAYQYKGAGDAKLKFKLLDGSDVEKATSRVGVLLLRLSS